MSRWLSLLLVLLLTVPLTASPVAGEDESWLDELFDLSNLTELGEGRFFTMYNPDGEVIMKTARIMHVGDTWIGRDNRKYEVYQVQDEKAWARQVRRRGDDRGSLIYNVRIWAAGIFGIARPVQEGGDEVNRRIAIYNTHGAEAYIPGDGTESDPQGGGIIDVADSLAAALKEKDIEIVQSKNTHVPHDPGAYKRSRATKQSLLEQGVDAAVDVHRDAIPAEQYIGEVEGEQVVQIQLVVGRQNQNQAVTQQFAEDLKAIADEKYPGLVKGIYSARGNYNQDMTPNSILIEVGSHENNKAGAEESVVLFADVLSTYLYGTQEGQERAAQNAPRGGRNVLRSILWILGILVVGGGAFLYISAGSWPEMKRKLQGFAKGEFGDLFKLRLKNRGNDDPDNM